VGPRAGLDAVVRRKILSPYRDWSIWKELTATNAQIYRETLTGTRN
jgi:hypothetical protein